MALNMRGRWLRVDKKTTTDEYLQLDMMRFAGSVDLTRLCAGSWQWTFASGRTSSIGYCVIPGEGVRLQYTSNGRDFNYVVKTTTTTPNYGGVRYWWLCPVCSKRVRILYGGAVFTCRTCANLTYETSQRGELLTTIDNRLHYLRRKLKGDWHFLHGPGMRPKHMKQAVYARLAREYINLLRMRNVAIVGAVADLVNLYGVGEQLSMSPDDLKSSVADEWRYHKEQPDRWQYVPPQPAEREEAPDDLNRFTLGELAQRAGVPYAFAQEAQAQGLIRPDQGRTTRRKRYRERLKNWLRKLHKLRGEGYSWGDITAWSKRRWQPGHEHERTWPA